MIRKENRFLTLTTIFLIVISLILVSCSNSSEGTDTSQTRSALQETQQPTSNAQPSEPSQPSQVSVSIQGNRFSPSDLKVKVGTTVTWISMDSVPHNIKSQDGTLDSPDLSRGQSWSFTFSNPGTYSYICGIHSFMKGSITVE